MDLETLSTKLDSITDDVLDQALLGIVKQNQSEALDMNAGQLFEGVDSQDQSLGEYRSQSYARFKQSLNPAGVVDLKLTGDFYRGLFVKADQFPVAFDSSDGKSEMLKEKYGEEIFGLDQNNLEQFRQEIKPDVQELYRSLLQL